MNCKLGKGAIDHCGLSLPDDKNIGKQVRFKNPKCPAEMEIYTIIACQKCWGFDENGKYTMVNGYRGVSENNQFGRPFKLKDVEFVEDDSSGKN